MLDDVNKLLIDNQIFIWLFLFNEKTNTTLLTLINYATSKWLPSEMIPHSVFPDANADTVLWSELSANYNNWFLICVPPTKQKEIPVLALSV